jgi:hypothetical protein
MGDTLSSILGGQTNGAQAGNGALDQNSGFYTAQQLKDQYAFQQAVQGKQNALGNQIQGVANGTGPNPALSQLQATTQQNIGQANAQLAGNRNLNPALAAKMANQNLVQTNQAAGNQAATLSAQQQLGALSQLGSLYGQQQQGAIGQQTTMNEANLGAEKINAGVAQQNAENANKANMGLLQSGASLAAAATGGKIKKTQIGSNPHMYADGTPDGGVAPVSEGTTDTPDSIASDASAGIGWSGDKSLGTDPAYASPAVNAALNPGGVSATAPMSTPMSGETTAPTMQQSPINGPSSGVGKYLANFLKGFADSQINKPSQTGGMMSAAMKAAPMASAAFHKGGKVDAILSPGEKYLTPAEAREVAKNKEKVTAVGKRVPGKAKVPGDSLANDIVPAKLEEGGIVVPRSKMGSAKEAAAFVKAHFAKRGKL